MRKTPCNMNCFQCVFPDCINNELLSPQLENYYMKRMKTADERAKKGRKPRKRMSDEERKRKQQERNRLYYQKNRDKVLARNKANYRRKIMASFSYERRIKMVAQEKREPLEVLFLIIFL